MTTPIMRRTGEMEQVLSEIEKGGKQYNFARQFGKELAMPLMAGIKAFGSIVVTAGWTAVYNKYKDLGWSDEAAAMRADRVIPEHTGGIVCQGIADDLHAKRDVEYVHDLH